MPATKESPDVAAPKEASRTKTNFADWTDLVNLLKAAAITLAFITLCLWPKFFVNKLKDAGISELALPGGATVKLAAEKASENSAAAASEVSKASINIAEALPVLEQAAVSSGDARLKEAVERVKSSYLQTRSAAEHSATALTNQQDVTNEIAPGTQSSTTKTTGWLYLGSVDPYKSNWRGESPFSIQPVDPQRIRTGENLVLATDAVLRGPSEPGKHAAAPVVGALKFGTRVRVLDVDYSHAISGDYFVWIKVEP